MTSWSRGEVTFTMRLSWTCSSRCSRRRSTGRSWWCAFVGFVPSTGQAQLVFAAEHECAGRADAYAVTAVYAGRVGQADVEFGRDVSVESASGDRNGKGVLRDVAARFDAFVAEDAAGVVSDVAVVVDLHWLRDGRCGVAVVLVVAGLGGISFGGSAGRPRRTAQGAPHSVAGSPPRPVRQDRSTEDARNSRTTGGSDAPARSLCARPCRPLLSASTPGRASAIPRLRPRRPDRR